MGWVTKDLNTMGSAVLKEFSTEMGAVPINKEKTAMTLGAILSIFFKHFDPFGYDFAARISLLLIANP